MALKLPYFSARHVPKMAFGMFPCSLYLVGADNFFFPNSDILVYLFKWILVRDCEVSVSQVIQVKVSDPSITVYDGTRLNVSLDEGIKVPVLWSATG